MPLRDHFHPPLDNRTSWEGFLGQSPALIVLALRRNLPARFVAAPRVRSGANVEIDIATFDREPDPPLDTPGVSEGTGATTVVWAPTQPTFAVAADLPVGDEYEVRVFDTKRNRRLLAAIEIVSPANKDRAEHRGVFVAKCAALLQNGVSVTIIDLVTTRNFNLYAELLELIDRTDPTLGSEPPSLYAVACRGIQTDQIWRLEAWSNTMTVGQPLPTLPLWLTNTLAVPLELEPIYEETCAVLSIT